MSLVDSAPRFVIVTTILPGNTSTLLLIPIKHGFCALIRVKMVEIGGNNNVSCWCLKSKELKCVGPTLAPRSFSQPWLFLEEHDMPTAPGLLELVLTMENMQIPTVTMVKPPFSDVFLVLFVFC
jgi:hypothetical protein